MSLPKILTKIFLSLIIAFLLVLSLAPSARAEWYNPDYTEFHTKVNSGGPNAIFGERYTQAQVWWIIWSLLTFIQEAPLPQDVRDCLAKPGDLSTLLPCLKAAKTLAEAPPETQKSLVASVFEERPISAVTYVKDIGRRIKLVPEANAQTTTGFGFTALNPILSLWKAARNVVYGLMVLVVIALAFMVMFKVKLNPQTSVTIQSAIPKIVIALILITFSYAIAGLLIDLMYVVIGIISVALSGAGGFGALFQNRSATEFFDLLTRGPSIIGLHLGVFGFLFKYWIGFIIDTVLLVVSADSSIAKLGALIGILIAIISIIILLWNGIKIIWMLFKALAQVLLGTIVAPFQILLGVIIPGMGFGSWMRSYISNLAVFPTVGLLFVIASLFLTLSINASFNGLWDFGFIPIVGDIINAISSQFGPLSNWPPLLGMGDANTTLAVVFLGTSFVIMTIIPKTVDLIQSIIKGQPFNYGAALNEATNPLGLRNVAQQVGLAEAGYQVGTEAQRRAGQRGRWEWFFRGLETYARRNKFIQ